MFGLWTTTCGQGVELLLWNMFGSMALMQLGSGLMSVAPITIEGFVDV